MKLNLYHNQDRTCIKLVNIEAHDNDVQLNRHLESWLFDQNERPTITYWKNDTITAVNPYKYNRVRIHHTYNEIRHTISYFCINDIILVEGLTQSSKL